MTASFRSVARNVRFYSAVAKKSNYSGKVTSQIMQCSTPQQLTKLLKRIKHDETAFFGPYEVTCAIKKFAAFKQYRACFTLFNDIKNQQPDKLDQTVYSYMIKLCLDQYGHNIDTDSTAMQKKRIKALQSSKKLFFEMQHQFNLEPHEHVLSALLSNCTKVITKKSLRMAEHHWERLMKNQYPNVKMNAIVWNTMISVYLKHYKLRQAMKLLDEMAQHVTPDHVTFSLIINGYRLNCNELIALDQDEDCLKNSDEYIQENIAENAITKHDMLSLTKRTLKDSLEKLGVPSIGILGAVIHNFAMLGDVDTCLSVLYFMLRDTENELCDMSIVHELGLDVMENVDALPAANIICFNLCLKSIVIHTELLLKQTAMVEKPLECPYLQWKFIENSLLEGLKNLEISNEFFVTFKVLIQICEVKLEYMAAKIKYIAEHIHVDETVQSEYLAKEYQTEIMEIFEKLQSLFEEMTAQYKFRPNHRTFNKMYKIGFRFTQLYTEHPALFDDMTEGSDPLRPFNDWLVNQMKLYGIK